MATMTTTLSTDPMIEVTPWSKTPTRAYEPVELEMIAMPDIRETIIVLSRRNGFRMGIHLTAAGIDQLAKELAEIKRAFARAAQIARG